MGCNDDNTGKLHICKEGDNFLVVTNHDVKLHEKKNTRGIVLYRAKSIKHCETTVGLLDGSFQQCSQQSLQPWHVFSPAQSLVRHSPDPTDL